MPGEERAHLQIQVADDIGERIAVVCPATRNLLLCGFQKVECRSVVAKFHEDGERFHQHADSAFQLLVLTSFMDTAEQGFLLVVVLGHQETIHTGKEGILEDALLFSEGFDGVNTDIQLSGKRTYFLRRFFQVRNQLTEGVAAVEGLGIPLFVFLESLRLSHFYFLADHVSLRDSLRSQRLAIVGGVDVVYNHVQCRSVGNDMMQVYQ